MKKGRNEKPPDSDLQEALAVLIKSTHTKSRPLSLTEIDHWLEIAVKELGSYEEVADRIVLSAKMLRQFSSVRRLSKNVQRLFASRKLDSVDAATHLAMLSPREQEAVANQLVAGHIDTSDLRAIVQLRRTTRGGSISQLLRKVKASKTEKTYVAEFVIRGARTQRDIAKAFQQYVRPKNIISLKADGALGRIVLSQEGKTELFQAAKKLGTSINQVIPTILYG